MEAVLIPSAMFASWHPTGSNLAGGSLWDVVLQPSPALGWWCSGLRTWRFIFRKDCIWVFSDSCTRKIGLCVEVTSSGFTSSLDAIMDCNISFQHDCISMINLGYFRLRTWSLIYKWIVSGLHTATREGSDFVQERHPLRFDFRTCGYYCTEHHGHPLID